MTHYSDTTIIGGGINGLLTARELTLAGHDVTLIDKVEIGRESSWAGGGILLPLYPWRQSPAISSLVMDSLARYPQLAASLLEATGIDPEWYDCGLLISKNPDIDKAVSWCQNNGISCQTPAESFFAGLDTQRQNPLWLPQIAQARNPRLLKSLKAYLLQAGVRLIERCEITGVSTDGDRVTAVTTLQETIRTGQLVLATGAWTNRALSKLFPSLHQTVEIEPVRGQMLLFAARPDSLPYMVLDGDQYLIPRRDGHILAGSTVEQTGFMKETTEQAKHNLYTFATGLMPALKDFPVVAHWAGLRPGTRDGVPYIGRHPQLQNLYLSAGHFRNGLVMGPASAVLLGDLILGRTPSVDPAPYQIQPRDMQ